MRKDTRKKLVKSHVIKGKSTNETNMLSKHTYIYVTVCVYNRMADSNC